MEDFPFWFGQVANAVTILAGLIAIAGVVWALRGRARIAVTPQFFSPFLARSLTLAISSVGSNPVRDVELVVGTVNADGFSMRGDGLPARSALNRGETLTVVGYETGEVIYADGPREGEFRWEFGEGEGWFLNVQWQSPLFPWRRLSRTYVWAPSRRFASQMPEVLSGRAELRFLRRAHDQSLNPMSPGFVPLPVTGVRATLATDETFDDELAQAREDHVLVGFGPTWQGKSWRDVKRILDAFANKHAAQMKVLAVNIDESPALATRFETNEVPVFKVIRGGEVVRSHVGVLSLTDLESEFSDFIA